MIDSLSKEQARKLVLFSQRLPPVKPRGSAIEATLSAIEQLGYIQIDTISVIQRAHHHTLWNRNTRYKVEQLDQLLEKKKVFEYWSHAAAYLPMRDYRLSLPRKHALKTGELNHWFKPEEQVMNYVLDRITAEGPLMAKDFEAGGTKRGGWGVKPAKQALETLFMQGDLMISRRVNFHKVYDLTERVLPEGIDISLPTRDEYARHLIRRFLAAHGVGLPVEMVYLLKNVKPMLISVLQEMRVAGEVLQIRIEETDYYTLPDTLERLNKPRSHRKLKILSPFDNLLIQRKRMRALFDFDYQLECYVPAAGRKYGYFVLPILWGERLVARMDSKADRKMSTLHIHSLLLEPGLSDLEGFAEAFGKELSAFLQFNGCSKVNVHKTAPAHLQSILSASDI